MTSRQNPTDQLAERIAALPKASVQQWNPPLSGTMAMHINRHGDWIHEGDKIQRPRLVALFASILRRDGDDYYLVTPVEKWRISVEVAPFVANLADWDANTEQWRFTTNIGEQIAAGPNHPIRVDYPAADAEPLPLVLVRDQLWALIGRAAFFDLAETAEPRAVKGERCYAIHSGGVSFCLAPIGPDE